MVRFRQAHAGFPPFIRGDWDEALPLYEAFIAECEAGESHHLEPSVRVGRALIRSWRGDDEGALADVTRALEVAREVHDPQTVVPALGVNVAVLVLAGRADEARRSAVELLESYRDHLLYGPTLVWLSQTARDFGLEEEVRAALVALGENPWVKPARAILEGDFERAAAFYEEKDFLVPAAQTRLLAAEAHWRRGEAARAREQLDLALPLFRKTRATRMLQRAEALLPASA